MKSGGGATGFHRSLALASGHVPALLRPPRHGRGPQPLPPWAPRNRQVHVPEGLVSRCLVPRPPRRPDVSIVGGSSHSHRGPRPGLERTPPGRDPGRDPEDARSARRDSPPHGVREIASLHPDRQQRAKAPHSRAQSARGKSRSGAHASDRVPRIGDRLAAPTLDRLAPMGRTALGAGFRNTQGGPAGRFRFSGG